MAVQFRKWLLRSFGQRIVGPGVVALLSLQQRVQLVVVECDLDFVLLVVDLHGLAPDPPILPCGELAFHRCHNPHLIDGSVARLRRASQRRTLPRSFAGL